MDLIGALLDPLQHSFNLARNVYGTDTAKLAEQIYRLETANFTSTQFLHSKSAGMVGFSSTFPYGWTTLEDFWSKNPVQKLYMAPTGLYPMNVNGTTFNYLKFATFTAALFALCERLNQEGNDANKWNGDPTGNYGKSVAQMQNSYVV